MITSLYIKDFALIDELETRFEPGLNIITGETGAGKSIIVGALNILLGERAQLESIRQGATKAVAEIILNIEDDAVLNEILTANEIEKGKEIILRREVRQSGSRAFVNDTPVQLQVLKLIGEQLVDLHGQHDHQLLLKEDKHREVIDNRKPVRQTLLTYQKAFEAMNSIRKELAALRRKERELREKQELYRYQVKELKEMELRDGEQAELEQEMRLLDGAEDLSLKAGLIMDAGREGEANALDLLRIIEQALLDMTRIESEFEMYQTELKSARVSIEELLNFTDKYRDQIEFNPKRLEFIRKRLGDFRKLEKKYGKPADELIGVLTELEQTLNLADNFELEIEKLEKKEREAADGLKKAAQQLHDSRLEEGAKLAEEIEQELLRLGFKHAAFEVHVNWLKDPNGWIIIDDNAISCTINGSDEVEFYISTNKGELPKPLSKTASGGEISRIMLALKSILAREQRLPVMIFDEIDTGISGPIALQVGRTMRELSERCQIISITHLPQIASMGHVHFVVGKSEENNRTVTRIEKLDNEAHIREVAKLMSGSQISDAALLSAKELVDSAG